MSAKSRFCYQNDFYAQYITIEKGCPFKSLKDEI
jgi:hypothetical protein